MIHAERGVVTMKSSNGGASAMQELYPPAIVPTKLRETRGVTKLWDGG